MLKRIIIALLLTTPAAAQDAPFECDNNFAECGTPEMSGGGNSGGGGSILINNTDLGDSYQTADDYDDDGVEDSSDNCPRERNSEQFDTDGDGVGDACDNCVDTHNLNQWNLDGDGLGDLCDPDMDGDEILNEEDNCLRVHNSLQVNTDSDGKGDACDDDLDGDGIPNEQDSCPMLVDNEPGNSNCFTDLDGDGVQDYGFNSDNCPGIHNPFQYDTDQDSSGDACDPDIDNDGIMNQVDNCNGVFNASQTDLDRDGRGDEGCDDYYCYVVYGDEDNCLDPEAPLKVYSPSLSVSLGEYVGLRMFMNRKNQPSRFTWSVTKRPPGSSASIDSPVGQTMDSSMYQYILKSNPSFKPDRPGEYDLTLTVETVFEDTESREAGTTAQHTFQIVVSGEFNEASGCNASPGNPQNNTLPVLAAAL